MAKSITNSPADGARRRPGRPQTARPAAIPNSIGRVREALGMSQEEFAAKLKLHPVSVSRIETGASDLGLKRLKQIADILKVEDPISLLRPIESLRMVRVIGVVQAGVFSESFEWRDPEDEYQVAVPDVPELRGVGLFGYEVKGPSMNKVYPEGTVVVIAKIHETNEDLISGKRYVVERIRHDGLREGTVKTFSVDQDGRGWLIPETDQPQYSAFAVDSVGEDTESLQALGRVMWSVRRE